MAMALIRKQFIGIFVVAMLLCLAASVAVSALAAHPPLPLPKPTVTGVFALEKPSFILGEPIWVTFRVANHGAKPIYIDEAMDEGSVLHDDFTFTARNAVGRVVSPPRPLLMIADGFVDQVKILPGGTYQRRMFLHDWFTLRHPGNYTLTCERDLAIHHGLATLDLPGQAHQKTSAYDEQSASIVTTLHLHILPANPVELGRVIEALEQRTLSANRPVRDDAARSLSVIPDPRIVPIMAALLLQYHRADPLNPNSSKFSAIQGLSQFSSNAAADALWPALQQNNADLRDAAGEALRRMKQTGRVFSRLKNKFTSLSPSVRMRAVDAIGATQDTHAFGLLMRALRDPVPAIRADAAQALGTLGDPRAIPVLKVRLNDTDFALRFACVQGLAALHVPIQTQWLTPLVRSYRPNHQYPATAAMDALRLDCGCAAALALAGCLQFGDARPSNTYNLFLINDLEACPNGPHDNLPWEGEDDPAALANNQRVLAAIQAWMKTQTIKSPQKSGNQRKI
jgi:HEAT repeat protein